MRVSTVLPSPSRGDREAARDPDTSRPVAPSPEDRSTVVPRNSVVTLKPDRVRPGNRAVLRVEPFVKPFDGVWGVGWDLERLEGSSWDYVGLLKAGRGKEWRAEFFIGHAGGSYEDIGFSGPASIDLKIPKLEAGRYLLGQVQSPWG